VRLGELAETFRCNKSLTELDLFGNLPGPDALEALIKMAEGFIFDDCNDRLALAGRILEFKCIAEKGGWQRIEFCAR